MSRSALRSAVSNAQPHEATSRGDRYDMILIGSGLGALTVASLMAQLRGQRVLILERHFKLGGYTHTFQRQGFHWDVGLHYVGQMSRDEMPRKLFDWVTQLGVQWQSMPDVFEKFVYPEFTFSVPSDRDRYIAGLIEQFPCEESGIRQYFKDTAQAMRAFALYCMANNSGPLTGWILRLISRLVQGWSSIDLSLTTQTYLDRHFSDNRLKALLTSQWFDYGLPPSQSPFVVHATLVNHFLQGAYYPVGGAGAIADSVQSVVEAAGGEILLNREASEILVEDGQAIGVRVCNTRSRQVEDYFAPVVVSNAGAVNTYLKLLPPDVEIPFRDRLKRYIQTHSPATNVSLYVGFANDPRQLGFRGENHWIYQQFDHEAIAHQSDQLLQGQPQQIYLSFPSLKDPDATKHTAELLSQADYSAFSDWNQQPWLRRDEDYQQLKTTIQEGLINTVNQHYPGFADLVDYVELSTPLTNEHFTDHPKGAIYGLPFSHERFRPENRAWTTAQTPVAGLYLTGVDLYMGGIVSALLSGVMTVSQLPEGAPYPVLFYQAGKYAAQHTN